MIQGKTTVIRQWNATWAKVITDGWTMTICGMTVGYGRGHKKIACKEVNCDTDDGDIVEENEQTES